MKENNLTQMSQSLRKSGRLFPQGHTGEQKPTGKSQSLRKSGRLFQNGENDNEIAALMSQSLRKSGRLFLNIPRMVNTFWKSRNPFVNQVVCFTDAERALWLKMKASQSLRKSGRLFQIK